MTVNMRQVEKIKIQKYDKDMVMIEAIGEGFSYAQYIEREDVRKIVDYILKTLTIPFGESTMLRVHSELFVHGGRDFDGYVLDINMVSTKKEIVQVRLRGRQALEFLYTILRFI